MRVDMASRDSRAFAVPENGTFGHEPPAPRRQDERSAVPPASLSSALGGEVRGSDADLTARVTALPTDAEIEFADCGLHRGDVQTFASPSRRGVLQPPRGGGSPRYPNHDDGFSATAARAAARNAHDHQHSNVYVKNLSEDVDEKSLKVLFDRFGTVESCCVIRDVSTNASRGFGFVKFLTVSQAKAAIDAMHGAHVRGRPLEVKFANADSTSTTGPHNSVGTVSDNVYVKGLPPRWGERELREFFTAFGGIVECRLLHASGTTTAGALIRFGSVEQALHAVVHANTVVPDPGGVPHVMRFADSHGKTRRGASGERSGKDSGSNSRGGSVSNGAGIPIPMEDSFFTAFGVSSSCGSGANGFDDGGGSGSGRRNLETGADGGGLRFDLFSARLDAATARQSQLRRHRSAQHYGAMGSSMGSSNASARIGSVGDSRGASAHGGYALGGGGGSRGAHAPRFLGSPPRSANVHDAFHEGNARNSFGDEGVGVGSFFGGNTDFASGFGSGRWYGSGTPSASPPAEFAPEPPRGAPEPNSTASARVGGLSAMFADGLDLGNVFEFSPSVVVSDDGVSRTTTTGGGGGGGRAVGAKASSSSSPGPFVSGSFGATDGSGGTARASGSRGSSVRGGNAFGPGSVLGRSLGNRTRPSTLLSISPVGSFEGAGGMWSSVGVGVGAGAGIGVETPRAFDRAETPGISADDARDLLARLETPEFEELPREIGDGVPGAERGASPSPPPPDSGTKSDRALLVRGAPGDPDAAELYLYRAFAPHGALVSIRGSGASREHVVEFAAAEEAWSARAALDGGELRVTGLGNAEAAPAASA